MIQFNSSWLVALQRGRERRRVGTGNRRRRQLAAARPYTEALETRTLLSSPSVTISFQDGVDGYSGTRDVSLDGLKSSVNDGARKKLVADGDPDVAALLSWDVSGISPSSQVEAAAITLNVINSSKHAFEFYGLKRQWLENEATFIHAAADAAWSQAGAAGAMDRDSTVLGTVAGASFGSVTVSLNASGVAVVQSWISNPMANFGLTIQNFDNARKDKLVVSSSEDRVAELRPKLTVTYRDGQPSAAPAVATNAGLDLDEGQETTIGQDRLEVTDPDNADSEVTFSLTAAPQHGSLKLNGTSLAAGSTWTQADINNNHLSYAHDGSATTSDRFQFEVSDPIRNSVSGTFSITVSLVNELPTLSTNAGLTLVSGQTATIGSSRLRVIDADHSAAQLRFTLTDLPAFGTLELNGTALNVNAAFTQDDVNQGLLAYRHNGSIAEPDGFLFTVSDAVGGMIPQTTFDITVTVEPPTSEPQYTVKQTPRLQLGNAPLAGFPGSDRDQVEVLWQTVPAGTGTADSFVVEYRKVGQSGWMNAGTTSTLDTAVEGRVIHSAVITGLDYNAQYEYQVHHLRSGSTLATYGSQFRTRLSAGDESAFRFAAYGDSAIITSNDGFRNVQKRITANGAAFSLLLGDNAYGSGTHPEFDARFDGSINPEAAEWIARHIDYGAIGNHEYNSGGQAYLDSFSMPIPVAGVTAPATPQVVEPNELTYSFDYGSVHFATFDSDKNSSGPRLDLTLDWIVADMQASTAQWKVVFAHHPIAGTPDKDVSPGDEYFQKVVSRLHAASVDLFVVGHSHTCGWTYPLTGSQNGQAVFVNDQDKVYSKGAGLIQLVSGTGGKAVRSGTYSQFPYFVAGYAGSTNPQGEDGHAQFEVTPSQLIVSYIAADDGAIIDQFTIADSGNQAIVTQGENDDAGIMDTTIRPASPNWTDQPLSSDISSTSDMLFSDTQELSALLLHIPKEGGDFFTPVQRPAGQRGG